VNTVLTHDLAREKAGDPWRCVQCGAVGATIAEVSEKPCQNPSTDNRNVLAAIDGSGPFTRKGEP
jgi:hypothetical protein